MALSITQLSKYLTGRDFSSSMENTSWSHTEEMDQDLPWNGLSCLSVVSYVLKFCSSTHHQDVFQTIKRLDVLASDINKPTTEAWKLAEMEREFAEIFVNNFMPKVEEFFTLSGSESNQNLAAFLHFLLQILNSESDHIQNMNSVTIQAGLKYLREALSFFLAVLGDTLFQYFELQDVENLLTEFKSMVNISGQFVYSYVFRASPVDVTSLGANGRVLFNQIDVLNARIREACIKFKDPPVSITANAKYIDVADALLIVNSLLEDLETFLAPRVDLIGDVKDQTTILQTELVSARSFLKDLNASRRTQTKIELKQCIKLIREASYEADYLINSFVLGNFPNWYISIRIPNVIQKLKFIGKTWYNGSITAHGISLSSEVSSQAIIQTSMAVDDNIIVGLETQMEEIRHNLLGGGSQNLQVICIHGMPGLGKTTFAKQVYNHRATTGYFDVCAWCVFSQTYQWRRVLIDILMGLRKLHDSNEIMKLKEHTLAEHVYKTLKGRRYFIIMDDVWDTDAFDYLHRFCPNDKNGSRILFTTRIQGVAPADIDYTLPFLTDDQCWELLKRKVFHDNLCPRELLLYGRQIAEKCNGLPLTVVVIAGILASMPREQSEWGKVEHSMKMYTKKNSMEILELSYKHLPNHLKLCFLYFGVFPEDAEIDVQKLIWSWIAEGLIQKDRDTRQEHLARQYLKHLVDRSLVQVTKYGSTGTTKSCSIHDQLRDMCLKRAYEENFMSFIKDNDVSSIYERHLRLTLSPATPTSLRPFSVHCRAFYGHLSDPSSCLPQMKHLRIMQLHPNEGVNISYKLKRIDMLVHLKYLVVDRMPHATLDKLVNLEILVIDSELNTVSVPSRILNLKKLRHLHVKRQATFHGYCDSSQQNNLESLSFLSIHRTKEYKILKSSCHLRKLKCLCPPQLPDLRILPELESLKIMVNSTSGVPDSVEINFPLNIKKLSLFGTRLPWERMSILGEFPNLQSLKLLWKAFKGKIWDTTCDEFQELIFLKLDGLKLEEWIATSDNFPRLEHLVLNKCDELLGIPLDLGDIPTLKIIEVHYCSTEAIESATKIEEQQIEYANPDLKIITTI